MALGVAQSRGLAPCGFLWAAWSTGREARRHKAPGVSLVADRAIQAAFLTSPPATPAQS